MTIRLASDSIQPNRPIPVIHTEDGDDFSPPLRWESLPSGTRQLALIVDDPDAPRPEPWVHWVIYGLSAETAELPQGIPAKERLDSPVAAAQGQNTWGTIGYRGPAPPRGHGTHHYHFRLYALDEALDLPPGLDKPALLAAIDGHILGEGELVGTYER